MTATTSVGHVGDRDALLRPFLSEAACRLRGASMERFGPARALTAVGQSANFVEALRKLEKVSRYREPILITGESGTGKEQFAEAAYLLGTPPGRPYVSVSCPQYQEGNLTVSELFGHVRGSFTGAVADRRGAFEEAGGGVLFLDEIADLPSSAQAMLLRTLSTGEFRPVGATSSRTAEVRIVSATNKPLNQLVLVNQFRYDLFFRLARFHIAIPPLRERGDDWRLLVDYCLLDLAWKYGISKQFSSASLRVLERASWPGNVRELLNLVTTGYAMADGDVIEPPDFVSLIQEEATPDPQDGSGDALYADLLAGRVGFWTHVYPAFMDRDLNRQQMRELIGRGLRESIGSYRRLITRFNLPDADYQRFMDFLRHHDIKPT